MTSRSGSSMVTSIFHAHGLWVGEIEPPNQYGYQHYENVHIRTMLNGMVTRGDVPGGMKRFTGGNGQEQVRAVLESIVPRDTPWVYKAGIDGWCMFDGLYPDMKIVFVKRRLDGVVASSADKSGDDPDHIESVVRPRYRLMDRLSEERGIPYVYSDEIVEGNYSSLEVAFKHCGLGFRPEIADRMVKPEKWKH